MRKIASSLAHATENLQYLSLRGLQVYERVQKVKEVKVVRGDTEGEDEAEEEEYEIVNEIASDIIENIIKLIKNAKNLQHLDLSNMALGRTLLQIAQEGIANSGSLLSVHLTHNDLKVTDIKELF